MIQTPPRRWLCHALAATLASSASGAILPAEIGSPAVAVPSRSWTIDDMVEVTRIAGTAVDGEGRAGAFIIRQPSLALGSDAYGLYLVDPEGRGPARKVVESAYLADLRWRPCTSSWSVRAEFDEGVQLYEVTSSGAVSPILTRRELAMVGGDDGQIISSHEARRATGIIAYGWSPDGKVLWYSALTQPSRDKLQARVDQGVFYDDSRTLPRNFRDPPGETLELHIFTPGPRSDRIVASVSGDARSAGRNFSAASVSWAANDRLIYSRIGTEGGRPKTVIEEYEPGRGARRLSSTKLDSFFIGAPVADGYLLVRRMADGTQRLIRIGNAVPAEVDLGPVPFTQIGGSFGYWPGAGGRALFGVRLEDRSGLVSLPGPDLSLTGIKDHLTDCSFDSDLKVGLCNRERIDLAPELVRIDARAGTVKVLARPNARYDAIRPLRTERVKWTDKAGASQPGYVTYPRNYEPGRRYPTLLFTHASDARNHFADRGFQWAFPLQVLAERGYLVLSVNERSGDAVAQRGYSTHSTDVPVARMQKAMGHDAVATMEGAASWAVERGLADPERLGIAGYSRGGIVTTITLSQSRMFKAGINADTAFFSAGGFWRGAQVRALYRTMFGGAPLDPRYSDNYRAFSPSARGEHFSGPLLQMFSGESAPTAIELDQALKEAKVPTELIGYPDETHVLHRPRSIASAARRTIDWFDYWLLGRQNGDSPQPEQYARWRAMEADWKRTKPTASSNPPGSAK